MSPDLPEIFEAQAAWQRARARLSWPEKIRLAELMREAARTLRGDSAGHIERTARGARPPKMGSGIDAVAATGASVEPTGRATENESGRRAAAEPA